MRRGRIGRGEELLGVYAWVIGDEEVLESWVDGAGDGDGEEEDDEEGEEVAGVGVDDAFGFGEDCPQV